MIPVPTEEELDRAGLDSSPFMPKWKDLPEGYRRGRSPYSAFFTATFFRGIADYSVEWYEGVDKVLAIRTLGLIARDFGSAHEHKEAAFCFLCDEWMRKVSWTDLKGGSGMVETDEASASSI